MLANLLIYSLVLWLAIKDRWLFIFILGLVVDWVLEQRFGSSSLMFLGVSLIVWLTKNYWPVRGSKQLKLKMR